MKWALAMAALALAGCTQKAPPPVDAGAPPLVSQDILNRPVLTTHAVVRHILIGWGALERNYGPLTMDPRATGRTEAEAEQLVRSLMARLGSGESYDTLLAQFSEDTVAAHGVTYEVRPNGKLEPQFQALSLRLRIDEIGVCRTPFGYHIVQRVQ